MTLCPERALQQTDRTKRRSGLKHHLKTVEDQMSTVVADKRARRKEGNTIPSDMSHT